MAIDLNTVKAHLRVDFISPEEDQLISLYIEAAKDAAELYIGSELPDPIPPSIEAGILMFVGTLYNTRQDTTETQRYSVPLAVERLWGSHRIHGVY